VGGGENPAGRERNSRSCTRYTDTKFSTRALCSLKSGWRNPNPVGAWHAVWASANVARGHARSLARRVPGSLGTSVGRETSPTRPSTPTSPSPTASSPSTGRGPRPGAGGKAGAGAAGARRQQWLGPQWLGSLDESNALTAAVWSQPMEQPHSRRTAAVVSALPSSRLPRPTPPHAPPPAPVPASPSVPASAKSASVVKKQWARS
jgi:hypothetical protein